MGEQAYQEFLKLPVGALFTSTAEWGERDAFIKVDGERYRRTYDYITWVAADVWNFTGILGGTGEGKDNWPGLVTMVEVPKWIAGAPLTDEECLERKAASQKRLREYVERTGEYPEMGFW